MSWRAAGPREGDVLLVTARELSRGGDGICEHEGTSLHVADLFPGEQARVRVLARARGSTRGRAHVLVRLREHPDRVAAACPRHFARPPGQCSGCPLMTLAPAAQRQLKARAIADRLGMEVDRFEWKDPSLGYRWSAKRVVGGRSGALRLGSYVRDSHRLAEMSGCLVDHPAIDACARELVAVADRIGIEPATMSSSGARGDLRYVWMRTDGRRVLLTLVTPSARGRARSLAQQLVQPAGIACCIQDGPGNQLRGHTVEHLRGDATISLELAGQRVEVGPLGFLQPHPAVASIAHRDLVGEPDGEPSSGTLALDLYAGGGLTTRLLRHTHTEVFACESNPESAKALGVAPEEAEAFLTRWIASARRPELVIANPPRGGMRDAVCASLLALAPTRIHLMSCNLESLAADLRRLAPGYLLQRVRAYDTLPQTTHVELVAWLVASGAA